MKRVLVSICLVLFILGTSFVSLLHLKRVTDEMNGMLDTLSAAVRQQDHAQVIELSNSFEETWETHEKLLLRYVHHEALDPITGSVARLSALGEYGKYPELACEIEHIQKLINHVYESEYPNFQNIF